MRMSAPKPGGGLCQRLHPARQRVPISCGYEPEIIAWVSPPSSVPKYTWDHLQIIKAMGLAEAALRKMLQPGEKFFPISSHTRRRPLSVQQLKRRFVSQVSGGPNVATGSVGLCGGNRCT